MRITARRAAPARPVGPGKVNDPGGNILTKHHEGSNPLTMSYDAANRLTTSLLGTTQLTTFTYSNAGEMTEERCDSLGIRATFVYDGEHRCVNEIRATTHSYTYAFDGLRRSAHMAGTANAISFVWDGNDLLNEYVPGGLSGRYLTLDGEVLSEKRGANRYVYGVDPLGSVVHLLDSGLNRAGTYVYWPYGEVLSHTGVDTPMQYVGHLGYYTSTTNRVYVRARWLRPDLGRWMTEDPIGFGGGDWNVHRYVSARPTVLPDASGASVYLCVVFGPPVGIQHEFVSTNHCGAVGYYGPCGKGWCSRDERHLGEIPGYYINGEQVHMPGRGNPQESVRCSLISHSDAVDMAVCECMRRACSSLDIYLIPLRCCVNWANDMIRCGFMHAGSLLDQIWWSL